MVFLPIDSNGAPDRLFSDVTVFFIDRIGFTSSSVIIRNKASDYQPNSLKYSITCFAAAK